MTTEIQDGLGLVLACLSHKLCGWVQKYNVSAVDQLMKERRRLEHRVAAAYHVLIMHQPP